MQKSIYYNPGLKQLAKNLRKKSTYGEVMMWLQLKKGKVLGYDFHRQKPINNYIIDFFCPVLMLAIEIDGCSHNLEGIADKDRKRQAELEKLGITFLRFSEYDARYNAGEVVEIIKYWIENKTTNASRAGRDRSVLNGGEHTSSSRWQSTPLERGK